MIQEYKRNCTVLLSNKKRSEKQYIQFILFKSTIPVEILVFFEL